MRWCAFFKLAYTLFELLYGPQCQHKELFIIDIFQIIGFTPINEVSTRRYTTATIYLNGSIACRGHHEGLVWFL